MNRAVRCILPALLCSVLVAGPGAAANSRSAHKRSPEADPAKPATALSDTPTAEVQAAAKVVHYGERDVVGVKTKLRYTTLIVLPKDEQILDFTCGDREYWVVNGNQNFAYVKPAKVGSQTNLNLITASGNVYSFVLSEISGSPGVEPDLKVFVEPKQGPMTLALNG